MKPAQLNVHNEEKLLDAFNIQLKYDGDIRALIVGHIFSQKMEVIELETHLRGNVRQMYFRTRSIRLIFQIILIIFFFFHKPEWCLLKPDIKNNCEEDYKGVNYQLLLPFFLDS